MRANIGHWLLLQVTLHPFAMDKWGRYLLRSPLNVDASSMLLSFTLRSGNDFQISKSWDLRPDE
jgi:hypothetical protein